MTLKNYRASLLSNIKLPVSFHHHLWIQTGATVRKLLSWFWPLTLTFCMDLILVIGDNSWKFHDDENIVKKVWQAVRLTDGRTENTIHGAAWLQLKQKLGSDCVRHDGKFYLYLTQNHVTAQRPGLPLFANYQYLWVELFWIVMAFLCKEASSYV